MVKKDSTELVEAAALEAAETSPPIGGMPARAGRLPVTLRALRHRNFQLFFGGQFPTQPNLIWHGQRPRTKQLVCCPAGPVLLCTGDVATAARR